jgi:protein-disulfide isomerase
MLENPTPPLSKPSRSLRSSRAARVNRSQRPLIYAVLLVCGFLVGIASGFLIWGNGTPAVAAAQPETQSLKRITVEEGGNPSIGPADAPITIIEFSDYQCPFCQQWHDQVFQRLLDEYPTQVRIVYRDFPLTSIHPQSVPAASAADCANEQDAYWPYHGKLFSYEYELGRDAYLKYAQEINLDMTAFTTCLDSNRYKDEVLADMNYGSTLGVYSTPTFYVNGMYLLGAQPYETFKALIDKELAGEIP